MCTLNVISWHVNGKSCSHSLQHYSVHAHLIQITSNTAIPAQLLIYHQLIIKTVRGVHLLHIFASDKATIYTYIYMRFISLAAIDFIPARYVARIYTVLSFLCAAHRKPLRSPSFRRSTLFFSANYVRYIVNIAYIFLPQCLWCESITTRQNLNGVNVPK